MTQAPHHRGGRPWAGSLVAVLLVVIATACGCGPSTAEGTTRDLEVKNRAGIVTVKGTERFTDGEWLKHGAFTFYGDRGEVLTTGQYKDGLESGTWTETYEDRCTGRGAYVEGLRSGPWQTFHAKGMPQDSGEYKRGLRTGLWLSYRRDGTKLREAEYRNGQENGRVVYFGPQGRLVNHELSGTYKDGERKKPLQ